MKDVKKQFANHLKKAMEAAGLEPIPSVLEREFNQRYMGTPMTLHGVRRWLLGETLPSIDKLEVLEKWLKSDFLSFRLPDSVRPGVKQNRKEWHVDIPANEQEIVQTFLQLPLQQKKIIREVILAFARK